MMKTDRVNKNNQQIHGNVFNRFKKTLKKIHFITIDLHDCAVASLAKTSRFTAMMNKETADRR